MQRIWTFVLRHRLALVGVLLVGSVHLIPHIVMGSALRALELPYHPLLLNGDEFLVNGVRAKMYAEEGKVSGELNLAENAGTTPSPLPPFPAALLGSATRVVGDLERTMKIFDAVLPALSFFLAYLVALELGMIRNLSLLAGAASVFIPRFFAWVPLFTSYYQAWLSRYLLLPSGRLPFDRIDDPQITVPVLLLFLYLTLRALKRREGGVVLGAGVLFGALFYTYFYYSTYVAVALVVAAVIFLLTRRRHEAKRVASIFFLGLFISVPYWLNMLSVIELPHYADFQERLGPEFGFLPYLNTTAILAYVQAALLSVAAWWMFRWRDRVTAVFLVAFLLPVFVVYNFQVVTGYNPQPDHWIKPRQVFLLFAFLALGWEFFVRRGLIFHRITGSLAAVGGIFFLWKALDTDNGFVAVVSAVGAVFAATIAFLSFRRTERVCALLPPAARALFIAFAVFLVVKGGVSAANFGVRRAFAASIPPPVEEGLHWLEREAPRESVVGTVSFLNTAQVVAFSGKRSFIPYGINTFASHEEILDRFYVLSAIVGVDPTSFGTFFATAANHPPTDIDREGISNLFGDAYRARKPGSIFTPSGQDAPFWTDEEHRRVVAGYDAVRRKGVFPPPYRLDYVFVGDRERVFAPHTDRRLVGLGFTKVFTKDSVAIYQAPARALED